MKAAAEASTTGRDAVGPGKGEREHGVAAVLSVLLATVLMGAAAMAVDLGNAMQTKRRSQNAADAAAFAGMQSYRQDLNNDSMTEQARVSKAIGEAKQYAEVNGNVSAGDWASCVDASRPVGYVSEPAANAGTCISVFTQGTFRIRVHIPAKVSAGFGRVLGVSEINADASSDMGIVPPTTATTTPAAGGATTTTAAPALANCGLYPIALSLTTVNFTATGGSLDVFNGSTPGNFGWMTWSGSNATGTLATSLTSPGDAGTYTNPNNPADHKLDLGDWVWGDPGISNASSVRDALDALIASGTTLTIPVWDNVTGNGNNTQYRVAGFALIRLTSYHLPGTNEIQAIYLGPGTCNGVTGTAAVTTTSAAPTSSTTTTTEPASCHIPLLANGSFETPITSGPNPTGWSYTGNVYRSSAFVADGSWSGLGQATSWLYQTVPAQAGANYRMTLFGGTHDPQQHAIVSMEFLNPAGQIIAATPFELDFDLDLPTGGVTAPYPTPFVNNGTGPIGGPYRINMIAPVGTSNVRISLRTTGGDYAKIDNASIVKC